MQLWTSGNLLKVLQIRDKSRNVVFVHAVHGQTSGEGRPMVKGGHECIINIQKYDVHACILKISASKKLFKLSSGNFVPIKC